MTVDWSFQVVTDGSFQGFNEPGIAHFKGDRYGNLAREIIQNSLDAGAKENETVYVKFNLHKIPPDKIPGFAELVKHVEMCAAEGANQEDRGNKAFKFFKNSLSKAENDFVYVLDISESNTVGMRGPCENGTPYHAFLKASGQSEKGKGAGGSHGIGKNASLVVSDFRTFFVSTCWDEGNGAERRYVQGRTTLTTHSWDGEIVGSVGYWGIVEGCYPLEDPSVADGDIPGWLERDSIGTSIFVIGFQRKKNWADNLIAAVAQNFFAAIARERLVVEIDGHVIDRDSIKLVLGNDRIKSSIKEHAGQPQSFTRSQAYYECLMCTDASSVTEEMQHPVLGNCRLIIHLHDDGPRKIAILRNDMLITDELKRLKTFHNMREFTAVLECLSSGGNEFLREMEPPRHTAFDPEELSTEDEQMLGNRALKLLAEKVRVLLGRHTQHETEADGPVEFIADLFPDEIETGRHDNIERDPEGELIFQPKPIKNPPLVRTTTEDELGDQDGVDGEGEQGGAGEEGGGGPGPGYGPGYGDGSGGTGDLSGGANRPTSILLENVRHISQESTKTRVIFTPAKSGEALISVASIGADLEDSINVVESSLGTLEEGFIRLSLKAGERIDMAITLERICEGGLRVSAHEV